MIVKRIWSMLVLAGGLVVALSSGSMAEDTLNPTPYFADFYNRASTFDGQPLPVGSIITAYDPSGVLCGRDVVRVPGEYGFMPVYGDDLSYTPDLDEGAEDGETISFKVNGYPALVVSGDPTWVEKASRDVQLDVPSSGVYIAMSAVSFPEDRVVAPGRTATMKVDVSNDGDGLDFYGVALSMSVPGGTGSYDWEAMEPDSFVYANSGEVVSVYFSVRAPTFTSYQVNTISYSVFSGLDPTLTADGTVELYLSITDVDDENDILPGSFALHQNYPNPFNPTTTISFELSVNSDVRVDIIDMLGRIVDGRDLGHLSLGHNEIVYDASDLASGVYFYRLTTESAVQAKKMVLIK